MDEVVFPEYVETFIEATNGYLGRFGFKLEQVSQNPKSQGRHYRISIGEDDPIELLVHRTSRSFDQAVGEYRARMYAVIDPGIVPHLRREDLNMNCFATLGALVTSERDASVTCQCLIQPDTPDTVAGVLATAVVHAPTSIFKGSLHAFGEKPSPIADQPSAWTDLDFEQLQREHPDLRPCAEDARTWQIFFRPHAVLLLKPVDNDPYWGGGLLCQSLYRERALARDEIVVDVNEMNILAMLADDTPMFGAWWRDDGLLVFRQSIPNFLKSLPNVTELLIAWAKSRLTAASELVEQARQLQEQGQPR